MIEQDNPTVQSIQEDKPLASSQDQMPGIKRLKVDPTWICGSLELMPGEKFYHIYVYTRIEGKERKLGFNIFAIETTDHRLRVVTHTFEENEHGERFEEEIRQKGVVPVSNLDLIVDGMSKRLEIEQASYELIDLSGFDSLEEQLEYLGTLFEDTATEVMESAAPKVIQE